MLFFSRIEAYSLEDLYYTSEEYPPYNYTEEGLVKGTSIELLKKIWTGLKIQPQKVHILPWARAYRGILKNPNQVLFGMERNKEREPLFKWACPILKSKQHTLIALKSNSIKIKVVDDLKGYSIGTIRHDIVEKQLMEKGTEQANIISKGSMEPILRMIKAGRIDLMVYEKEAIPSMLKHFGYEPEDFEVVFLLPDAPICFAFSKAVDDEIVNEFQRVLTDIKEEQNSLSSK